jgi:hypothetical protein
MTEPRKLAIAAGVCYLVSDFPAFAAVILYTPILGNINYIVSPGPDIGVLWGAFCELIVAFAIIGTAVTLFPIVKKHQEAVALGYVALRTASSGHHRYRHHQPPCGRDVAAARSFGHRHRLAGHTRKGSGGLPQLDLPDWARLHERS